MSKRAFWVEPLFGEAKDFHRLGRFRLRGLMKVNLEGVMIAAGQNIKRLLKHASDDFCHSFSLPILSFELAVRIPLVGCTLCWAALLYG